MDLPSYEKKVRRELGWWINYEGKREWTQMGDPYEEKATGAEILAYQLLLKYAKTMETVTA
jgi:hypothetical protein